MLCPYCHKWNRANMTYCSYCGTALMAQQKTQPSWVADFNDRQKPKAYIRVDEDGVTETTADPRDVLASEMADLKIRMQDGQQQHQDQTHYAFKRRKASDKRRIETDLNTAAFFEPLQSPSIDESLESMATRPTRNQLRQQRQDYRSEYSIFSNENEESQTHQEPKQEPVPNYQYPAYDTSLYQSPVESAYAKSRAKVKQTPEKKHIGKKVFIGILLAALGAVAYFVVTAFVLPMMNQSTVESTGPIMVAAVMRDDMAAHEITIPGKEGQRIVLKELRTSKIVTDGYATFDIPDHTWYDSETSQDTASMTITLSPYLVLDSGKQQALEQIQYDISIPLSPIELITPDSTYKSISMSMYTISFRVRKESTVLINGKDYSDLVREGTGTDELTTISYNATVQPIGANEFNIIVRSQYCRENRLSIVLDRPVQDIPLDLASDTATSSSSASGTMTIRGTTLPGAVVKVLSPYSDLDITNTSVDGTFSFKAKFDKIGNNTVIITVDFPGRKTTRLEHIVNYVPNIDVYSRKAWDIVTQYSDLMDNLDIRKNNSQIYVCKGVITEIDTTKPQRAFMDVGSDGNEMLIYLENATSTTWEEEGNYRVYADAYGMYNGVPWLIVRYCYNNGSTSKTSK